MAQWAIKSQENFRAEWVAKLGHDEFERRSAIAKFKADELDDGTNVGWRESCMLSGIFLSIAPALNPEAFVKLDQLPVAKWRSLAYRIAA